MELTKVKLADIFMPIVVGYTTAVTVMFWIFALVILVPSLLMGDQGVTTTGEPVSLIWVILGVVVGAPIGAILQGILLAGICGFGLAVYRHCFVGK